VNRALRAATMGVLLLSPIALSACSAGQVTQTATQQRDKTGGQAQIGELTLRQAQLKSPQGGTYEAGDDAQLQLAIINSGAEDDALVAIGGQGFAEADVRMSRPAGTSGDEIPIPARTSVYIGDDVRILLRDLEEPLTTGQYLDLELTFENAGEITLQVTVATPEESLERGDAYDFHGEEGAEGESAE
jgi:copper(I)-binding protein